MHERWRVVAIGLGLAAVAGCVVAEPVVVATPPPAPVLRVEPIPPPPGASHVWAPGYWAWRGPRRGYVWIPGRYLVPTHPGAVWIPGHWAPSPAGWVWVEGHWRLR